MVDTKMATYYKDGILRYTKISAQSAVQSALKTIGSEQETNGHPKHKLFDMVSKLTASLIGDFLWMKFKFSFNKFIKTNIENP